MRWMKASFSVNPDFFFLAKLWKWKRFGAACVFFLISFKKSNRKLLLRSALKNRKTIYYLYLTFKLDVLLSNLLAPVSNDPFNGCSTLFSPLSDRVCGDVDFARLFSFGWCSPFIVGLLRSIVSLACCCCSPAPFVLHFTQMNMSGMWRRFILAQNKCTQVRHFEHSIIGRAAYGLPQ